MGMKRMHTEKEIEAIAEEAGGGFDPAVIPEGEITQGGIIGVNADGEAVKGDLFGKYVRITNAPSSHILTDQEFEAFKDGTFIKGVLFGLYNPVIYPFGEAEDGNYYGFAMGIDDTFKVKTVLRGYAINKTTKQLSAKKIFIDCLNNTNSMNIYGEPLSINGKVFPNYPWPWDDKSFTLKMVNGTLTWTEGIGLYLHNLTFTDSTNATRYLSVITDSRTPFEIVSGTGPTLIQCANASFIIVPDSGKSLPMYDNKSFHPSVRTLSFPSGSNTVEYTSYDISTLDQDEVKPL